MQYNVIHSILFAITYFMDSVSSFCAKNTNKLIKHYISGVGLVLILEVQVFLNARQWTNSIQNYSKSDIPSLGSYRTVEAQHGCTADSLM
jgi:hypothetical protein